MMKVLLRLMHIFVVATLELSICTALSSPLKVSFDKVASNNCPLDDVKQDVMDIAVYRNKLIDADMIVSSKLELREKYDKTEAAIKGSFIGVVIGLCVGVATYLSKDGEFVEALQNFLGISIGIGTPLAVNFATGNKVYVPTIEQARRGLIQDFVDGIWRNGDVSFVARISDLAFHNGKYKPSNGIVAVCDTQIRNTLDSSKKYGRLPCHLHLMNMSVDVDMRRQGIATKVCKGTPYIYDWLLQIRHAHFIIITNIEKLLKSIEDYARFETDAEILTLLVDDSNEYAIRLYEKLGFLGESIGTPNASQKYGSFTYGRSIMIKPL